MDVVGPELIKILPSILWLLFVAVMVSVLYRPIRDDILPRLKTFEAAGVKFSVVRESIDAAIRLADEVGRANTQKSSQWNIHTEPGAAQKVENRAKANINVFKNTFILWVDDHPEFNINERRMFKQLGVEIDTAQDSQTALQMLSIGQYDLIVSDIARGDDPEAGLKFLSQLRQQNNNTNLIFYIGRLDSSQVPKGAFGITNRPDQLLHLTLDVLERTKY